MKFFKYVKLLASVFVLSTLAGRAASNDTPGYLFVNATVTDAEKLGTYGRALPPVYAKYQGRYLIFGGIGRGVHVVSGSPKHESVIFAEFSSLADVEKFWWSEDYRAVVPLRDGAGQFDVLGLSGTGNEPYTAQNGVQPAYLFTVIKVKDREKMMAYMQATQNLIEDSPGRVMVIARPEDMAILEGPAPEFTLEISSWPSLAAIDAFMSNPVYQAVIPMRDAAMDVTVLAAEVPKPR